MPADAPTATQQASEASVLAFDGRLPPDAQGGFSATDYEMTYAPDGSPRFVKAAGAMAAVGAFSAEVADNTLSGGGKAMVLVGTDMYVGGGFTDAGGNTSADRVARWHGTQWNALGREVATLYDGPGEAARDVAVSVETVSLPAGLYVVRATGAGFTATRAHRRALSLALRQPWGAQRGD